MPDISARSPHFYEISTASLTSPSNRTADGKFRKVKIELVAPGRLPLLVTDQKGKKQKYVVVFPRRVQRA